MTARYFRYDLNFREPAGTSRGVLLQKESWFIVLEGDGKRGLGECGILRGLSADDRPDYEEKLDWACKNIQLGEENLWNALQEFPSIQFGLEMAFRSLASEDPMVLFPSAFTNGQSGIHINGLVWMGREEAMLKQIGDKIGQGFNCVKLKIGAIGFDQELRLLEFIREHHPPEEIEIRVDANGAFSPSEAFGKLERLTAFGIHSIEQPIAAGQWNEMAALCRQTPIPIALDEELIGVWQPEKRRELLETIRPDYLIFKPSFIGGIRGTSHWIALCKESGIDWWITSALESSIGLNAIAQWTYSLGVRMPQGLGTGALYTNNFESPLHVSAGKLWYDPAKDWEFPSGYIKM